MIVLTILASGNGSNFENLVERLHGRRLGEVRGLCPGLGEVRGLDSKTLHVSSLICNKADAFVLTRASNLGIPSYVIESKGRTRDEFEGQLFERLEVLKADGLSMILLAGFMRILSPSFFQRGLGLPMLNIHPSYLPLHKGAGAIEKSFYDSRDFGGVSIHEVNAEVDGGRLVLQEKLLKIPGEGLDGFSLRIHSLERDIYPRAIVKFIYESRRFHETS